MSVSNEPIDIPVLPPLETSPFNTNNDNLLVPADKDSASFQSPSLSFAESFSTALSSPGDASEEATKLPLSSLSPLQNLRKSISVDSFVQYGREGSRNYSNQSPKHLKNSLYDTEMGTDSNTHPEVEPWSSRRENLSSSSTPVDHDSPSPLDFDVDRSDSITDANSSERFRRISLKTQEPTIPFIRGGHLPLPSRARNNSASMASTVTAIRERGVVSSMSSLQSPSLNSSTYEFFPAGRTRSGSLGYNPPQSSKRVVNTVLESIQTVVLAVIGTTGCGKSTVIRKGLSQYKLSETTTLMESSHPSRLPRSVDKRRSSSLTVDLPASPVSPVTSQPAIIDSIEVEISSTSNVPLPWPKDLPTIDGLIICYDRSNKSSFEPVEALLKNYRSTNLPIMVLGCKSDLSSEVDSNDSLSMLKKYDTGLIEVSNQSDDGKEKMRQSFSYMLKAVARQRGIVSFDLLSIVINTGVVPKKQDDARNPAAPPPLHRVGTPWTDFEQTAPSSSTLIPSTSETPSKSENTDIPPNTSPPIPAAITQSPIWSQSSNDDNIDSQPSVGTELLPAVSSEDTHTEPVENLPSHIDEPAPSIVQKKTVKEPRPAQWADLDALLDKLLFLAVSGEEPNFITNFLLTFRRFTTPRTVLLAMQKRMRQLDNPSGDPMFACFAQMRICHLLETWIHDFAHDFSVPGTSGALNALIKSIIAKTHLLHYGSEFLPFLEQLPSLKDQDTAWAKKVEFIENESDESEAEDDETRVGDTESVEMDSDVLPPSTSPQASFPARERKSSTPLPKTISIPPQLNSYLQSNQDQPPKQQLKELVKLAQEVLNTDPSEIAQEITRIWVKLFLNIKPRDWLHYTFVSGKTIGEPITAFNTVSNHLADWVVSLILCHERPRNRARQIEKFVEIAQKLRQMNNYSALRAFVAGINNATDDPTMELFKTKSPDASKNLRSWDVLLQQVRAHRAYRLALRNSKGACIPALEVHMTDLIRAHEGNGDSNPAYPDKIHWGKFNMMGRFISSTLQCQAQCRNSHDYDFPERPAITQLIFKANVMSIEMQKSRLKSQEFDYDDAVPHSQPKDVAGLRKIFFW
ncbi:Ras guanine nucleotide exchange factor P [Psilocybe cubensis]|uniref:Ras guanine nucleotide exchange factor P n=1 Tax=Psilocybe cubensis TaxID=181762 RepID=A0ACB8HGW7_PSICU|nr:Ras guanine nucleotide exchange factor P [Psilocybe cubensis]KAH9486912.1 Ras guanine nucleotide exchange factor P [Psilocybe cubensis]